MIEILDAGFYSSIQDLGRVGWEQFGVPRSGAMDEFALRAANRLVGNPDDSACIEVGLGGFQFVALNQVRIAVCGKGFSCCVDGKRMSLWQSIVVQKGQVVQVGHEGGGMWAVIAFQGGIDVKSVMDSCSTCLVGGFGGWFGRLLKQGDCLPIGKPNKILERLSNRFYPFEVIPSYRTDPVLRVVVGPHSYLMEQDVYAQFFQKTYTLSTSSNRTGYRLQGEAVVSKLSGELVSLGMLPGAIQLPPQGEPIVMMADSPTSGGYPIVAVVIRADLPILAQCEPLKSQIRFRPVSVKQAREAYLALFKSLDLYENNSNLSELWEWAGSVQ